MNTAGLPQKVLYALSMLTIALAAGLLIYVYFLIYIDGNPPLTITPEIMPVSLSADNNHITTLPEEVCRYVDVPSIVYVSFHNHLIYELEPETMVGNPKGCFKLGRTRLIPSIIPDGIYYLEARNEYKVNAISTRYVYWRTENFTINRTGRIN